MHPAAGGGDALNPLTLLLPALVPSWNFFDTIGPSPRIEYALTERPEDEPADWREFRPRPARLSPAATARRLFWNPAWNETLFLVALAERLIREPSARDEERILARIAAGLAREAGGKPLPPWLRFRLLFLGREGEGAFAEVLFTAEPRRRGDIAPP